MRPSFTTVEKLVDGVSIYDSVSIISSPPINTNDSVIITNYSIMLTVRVKIEHFESNRDGGELFIKLKEKIEKLKVA